MFKFKQNMVIEIVNWNLFQQKTDYQKSDLFTKTKNIQQHLTLE